jgi:hypothetical protein
MVQMTHCLHQRILLLKRKEMNEVAKVEYQDPPSSKSRGRSGSVGFKVDQCLQVSL